MELRFDEGCKWTLEGDKALGRKELKMAKPAITFSNLKIAVDNWTEILINYIAGRIQIKV